GNEFRLFSFSAAGVPTLLHVSPTLPVSWQLVDVKISPEAASALGNATSIAWGYDTNGYAVAAVTETGHTTHILRLDPSAASITLLCHLPSPVTHTVARVTCCDKRVLLSNVSGSEVTVVSTDTGSTQECSVKGTIHSICPVGTVVHDGNNLHVSVRDGTCVCVCPSAMDHCVRGTSLLWVSRDRGGAKTTLSSLDLSPLRSTPQLALGSDAVPSIPLFPWVCEREGSPATIRCPLSSGCIDITLG
ncbi:hypothetical protein KIPB_014898, partial [Kipferlia bialata]